MKLKSENSRPEHAVTPLFIENEEWNGETDRDAAKDVWHVGGEFGKFLDAKAAFRAAGYRIQTAEIVQTHPVWVFRLACTTIPNIEGADRFLHRVRDVMWRANVYFRDDDMVICFSGNRIIISILWSVPATGKRREAAWDESRFRMLLDQLS
jgi:hypothetical protein